MEESFIVLKHPELCLASLCSGLGAMVLSSSESITQYQYPRFHKRGDQGKPSYSFRTHSAQGLPARASQRMESCCDCRHSPRKVASSTRAFRSALLQSNAPCLWVADLLVLLLLRRCRAWWQRLSLRGCS